MKNLLTNSVLGQQIKTLVNRAQGPGIYTAAWQGVNDAGVVVGSGVYFYVVRFNNDTSTKSVANKLLLIK